ncbi:hypothetical protein BaRGS_00008797, partial [Batillaria attramentaria]
LATGSSCPHDVSKSANACFTSYSREYQNMHNSPARLCCGVDAETLRAFCRDKSRGVKRSQRVQFNHKKPSRQRCSMTIVHARCDVQSAVSVDTDRKESEFYDSSLAEAGGTSYMNGMQCISSLKGQCPESKHGAIDSALSSLQGAEDALKSLCADDTNIEVYARYQSCFTRAGPTSEMCMQRHLNTSLKLLASKNSKMDAKHMDEFCSDMRGMLKCIQNNVRQQCGEEAADLAPTLVKPMVRQSTKCDYSVVVVTKAPNSRNNNPAPSSHGGYQHTGDSGSASSLVLSPATILVLCVACVLRTALYGA